MFELKFFGFVFLFYSFCQHPLTPHTPNKKEEEEIHSKYENDENDRHRIIFRSFVLFVIMNIKLMPDRLQVSDFLFWFLFLFVFVFVIYHWFICWQFTLSINQIARKFR